MRAFYQIQPESRLALTRSWLARWVVGLIVALVFALGVALVACAKPRIVTVKAPPCPMMSDQAIDESVGVPYSIGMWIDEMIRYCEARE